MGEYYAASTSADFSASAAASAAAVILARYQALLASPDTRHVRFGTSWTFEAPEKMDEVHYSYGQAMYVSIEKATSPINGQEESYWLNCNYNCNDRFEDLIQPASGMEIESNMVPFYQTIRFAGHPNIIGIDEIYTCNDAQMIICKRIDFRFDNYLEHFREDLLSNDCLVTVHFRKIIRNLVDGLQYLHSKHLAHGNLRLSTTYVSRNGEYQGKLAEFGYDSNAQNLEETQKSDWADLGNLLHEALKILFKEETTRNQQYDMLDLCKILQHPELIEETPKEFIMGHPALITCAYRRVFYINCAVAFVERCKLERRFVDDDVLTTKPWTENIGSKEDSEKLVKYIEQATEDDTDDIIVRPKHQISYDPSSGWDFIKFVSYFLQYHEMRLDADTDIQDIVGEDACSVELYFRRYQPKMLIALKTVAEEAGFNIKKAFG